MDVAKIITKELQADLQPIVETTPSCDSEVIGFVCPTYYWGLPHLVETFIKELDISSKHPYIFGSMMAKSAGGALGSLDALLKEKGFQLDYGKVIKSVSNYIVEYNVKQVAIAPLVEGARKEAMACAKEIKMQKQNSHKTIPVITNAFHKLYMKKCGSGDRKFQVHEQCINCGTCEVVCPVKNIRIEKGRPVFLHNCEHCIACMHWCPTQAIQYGRRTQKRKRYHNPNVKLHELHQSESLKK